MAFWLVNVTVEGKTMANFHALEKTTTESKHWVHFVRIVLLQNTANRLNGLHVLIWLVTTHVMKRIWSWNFTIRCSEVNSYLKTNFTTTKNIIKESDTLLDDDLTDGNLHSLIF